MIAEDVIAQILGRTDIVELIGSYLPLKAAGRVHKALCPFHTEKTPSFVVNPDRQIFHCFGCGEGGDALAFLVKHERLTFPEAVRLLAERAGVSIPARAGGDRIDREGRLALFEVLREALAYFRENLRGSEGAPGREYLTGRGLTPALIERFQLGLALPRWDGLLRALVRRGRSEKLLEAAGLVVPRQSGSGHYDRFRHRLMIPIWDASGKVVGFGGRALEANEVKYLNSPETAAYRKGTHLYGLNLAAHAIRERKQAIVVEGYFDAIALHAYGFENAVATLGTALTLEQARLLARYASTVVLLFDPDPPGIGAARRNLENLINVELDWRIVLLPEGRDPDAYLRARGAAEFAAALGRAQDLVDFFLDRRVSGLDVADPIQESRAVDGLVEIVSGVDNPIRREGYIRRVAQRTALTDRALLEAVARQRGRAGRRDAAPASTGARPAEAAGAPPSAEEQLVAIGLNHPAWRGRIAGALVPAEVRDPVLQRIFVEFIQGKADDGSALPDSGRRPLSAYPPEVQQRLAALWAGGFQIPPADAAGEGEGGPPEDRIGRMVEDCLARIRQDRLSLERQRLRRALEAAGRDGDPERVLRLLAEHPSIKRREANERERTA